MNYNASAQVNYNDQNAWGVLATLFIYLALLYINEFVAGIVVIVLTIWFIVQDRKVLAAEGRVVPSKWWLLLSPGYLYRRAVLNNDPKMKKIVIIGTLLYIALAVFSTMYEVRDSGALAAESYCKTTTRILSDNNYDSKCLSVKDIKEVSDKHYRAVAMLDNGNDLPITIEYKDLENYYITIRGL